VANIEQTTRMRIDFGNVQAAARCREPLVPVVLQDADTLEVLFVGHAQSAQPTGRECGLPFLIGSVGVSSRRSERTAMKRDPVAAGEGAKLRR
jgi:hypothetical protein